MVGLLNRDYTVSVSVFEAKAHFGELLDRVERGEPLAHRDAKRLLASERRKRIAATDTARVSAVFQELGIQVDRAGGVRVLARSEMGEERESPMARAYRRSWNAA
jgi:antitoxin (DNA-binding transcriptional repressor) of toxin-antitoxin stability system